MDLDSLTQLGIAGAAIAALVYTTKGYLEVFKNHISHNTDAMTELKEVLAGLKEVIVRLNGKK